jgi:hypothetical protein
MVYREGEVQWMKDSLVPFCDFMDEVIDRARAVNFCDREKWRHISLVLLLRLAFAGRDGRISAVPLVQQLLLCMRWRGCYEKHGLLHAAVFDNL